MGGKGSAKVYDYLLSIHYGICHGPIDSINEVRIKGKRVWCGSVTERRDVCIDLPDIFGGDGKEGGVRGVVECYMGDYTQLASEELCARMGLPQDQAPAYRGIASLFFRGTFGDGFKWQTNNPYMPEADVSVTRLFRELNTEYAAIWPLGEDAPEFTGSWDIPLLPDGNTYDATVTRPTLIDIPGVGPNPNDPIGDFTAVSTYENVYCGFTLEEQGFNVGEYYRTKVPVDEETGEPMQVTNTNLPSDVEIDSGKARLVVDLSVKFKGWRPSFAGIGIAQYYVWYYTGVVDPETNELVPGEVIDFDSAGGSGSIAIIRKTWTLPPGTRFIRQYWGKNEYPLTDYDSKEGSVKLNWDGMEFGHCQIDQTMMLPDANPANFLYELILNSEWGAGDDPSRINTESFQYLSELLFNERFGISFKWVRSAKNETIAKEVCDHIKAFIYQSPTDGKWTVTALRNDYDIDNLTVIDPSNCKIISGKRPLWGEVTNEIIVTYTDPATEEEATVSSLNTASLAIQSGYSSDSRNYYMVRNSRLAQALADRDVQEAGYPLWAGELEISPSIEVFPGKVLRMMNYPRFDIEDMVVRVMSITGGVPGNRKIRIEVTEDIFSVDTTTYKPQQEPLLDEANYGPEKLDRQFVMAAPYPMLMLSGVSPDEVESNAPAQIMLPMGASDARDFNNIDIWSRVATSWNAVGTVDEYDSAQTIEALAPEVESELPRATIDAIGGGMLFPGDFVLITKYFNIKPNATSEGLDAVSEIIRLDSFNVSTQRWDVSRGMFDTIPMEWPVGSLVWRLPNSSGDALNILAIPETDYGFKFLPRAAGKTLPLLDAETVSYFVDPRAERPIRPANCQVMNGGVGFGFSEAVFTDLPLPTEITVTWSNRNRLDEDALQPNWGAPSTSLEPGQTTTIRVFDVSGNMNAEYTGLTGTSHTFPVSDLGGTGIGYVEFWSERGLYESLQAARRYVRVGDGAGWGYDWGNNWG